MYLWAALIELTGYEDRSWEQGEGIWGDKWGTDKIISQCTQVWKSQKLTRLYFLYLS